MKRKIIMAVIALFSISFFIIGCSSINNMEKGVIQTAVKGNIVPSYLEAVNNQVNFDYMINFGPKEFPKKMILKITPRMQFSGKSVALEPIMLQGEKVKDTDYPMISWKGYTEYVAKVSMPFMEGMQNGILWADIEAMSPDGKDLVVLEPVILNDKGVRAWMKYSYDIDNVMYVPVYSEKFVSPQNPMKELGVLGGSVHFPLGSSVIPMDQKDTPELMMAQKTMKQIIENPNTVIEKIVFYASSSPEGPDMLNKNLTRQRANVSQKYFSQLLGLNDSKAMNAKLAMDNQQIQNQTSTSGGKNSKGDVALKFSNNDKSISSNTMDHYTMQKNRNINNPKPVQKPATYNTLSQQQYNKAMSNICETDMVSENWIGLYELLSLSNIPNKMMVVKDLKNESNNRKREAMLKKYMEEYPIIAETLLPKLRRGDFYVFFSIIANVKEVSDITLYVPQFETNVNPTLINDWEMLNDMAVVAIKNKDYNKAKRLLEQAAELSQDARIMNNLAIVHAQTGNLPGAISILNNRELSKEAMYNMGLMLMANGNYNKAKHYLKEMPNFNLGYSQLMNGESNNAVQTFKNPATTKEMNTWYNKLNNMPSDATMSDNERIYVMNMGMKQYVMAVAGARANDPDFMVTSLTKAIQANPELKKWAQTDVEFYPYKSNPDYIKLVGTQIQGDITNNQLPSQPVNISEIEVNDEQGNSINESTGNTLEGVTGDNEIDAANMSRKEYRKYKKAMKENEEELGNLNMDGLNINANEAQQDLSKKEVKMIEQLQELNIDPDQVDMSTMDKKKLNMMEEMQELNMDPMLAANLSNKDIKDLIKAEKKQLKSNAVNTATGDKMNKKIAKWTKDFTQSQMQEVYSMDLASMSKKQIKKAIKAIK